MKLLPSFLRKSGVERTVAESPATDLQEVRKDVARVLEAPVESRLEQVWNVLSNHSARLVALAAAGTLEGCGPITGNGYADTAIIGAGLLGTAFALFGFKFLKPSEFVILRNRWIGGRAAGYDKQGGVAVWFRPIHTPWVVNPAQPDDVTIDGTEKTLPATGDWSDDFEIGMVPVHINWSVVIRLTSPKQTMFALGPNWQAIQERIKDTTNKIIIAHLGRQPMPANATPDVVVQNIMNDLVGHTARINEILRSEVGDTWGCTLEIQLGPVSEPPAIQQRRIELEQAAIDVRIAHTRIGEAEAQGQAAARKAAGDAQAVGIMLKAKVDAVQGADPVVAAVILAGEGGNASGVAQAAVTASAIRGAAQQIAQSGINVTVKPGSGTGTPSSGSTS